MRKTKLLILLATIGLGVSATSCAMPEFLYHTMEGHVHDPVGYYNYYHHWTQCSECGEILSDSEHTFGDMISDEYGHYGVCSECGYALSEAHKYRYDSVDENYHTAICTICLYIAGTSSHNFTGYPVTDSVYDEESGDYVDVIGHCIACKDCGYVLVEFEEHSIDSITSYDDDYHYYTCLDCGYSVAEAHTLSDYSYEVSLLENDDDDDDDYGDDDDNEDFEDDDEYEDVEYYAVVTVTGICEVCGNSVSHSYYLTQDEYEEYFGSDDN